MEKILIERINALARKQRTPGGLTEAEKAEQAALRRQYLDEWRRGMEATLESVVLQRPDGSREKLKKREPDPRVLN